MILAAALCGFFNKKEQGYDFVEKASACAEGIFTNQAEQLCELMSTSSLERVQYLGTSDAVGLLTEGHLKMLEMTDGTLATRVDSFLGLRHGPQVFVNKNSVVVAVLSKDPYVRQYEIDMLNELKTKNQGYGYVVIGQNPDEVKLSKLITCSTGDMDRFATLLPSIVMVQLLGFFKSIALGLSPDAPSASGTINRVVQGVNIYPYNK